MEVDSSLVSDVLATNKLVGLSSGSTRDLNVNKKFWLKAGKWKRQARDQVRLDSGPEAEVHLGKRNWNLENGSVHQELKFVKNGIRATDVNYGQLSGVNRQPGEGLRKFNLALGVLFNL
ncbi:hypothetical protein Q3G72_003564 [Acer saccharum]|nr:hypothetical protein Q3G72_003564 [Acer saccharum]